MGPLLLLKVSLLLAVTLVAARLLRRAPAMARHGLWSLAFGSLLLLAPLAALLPALHVPVPAGWESPAPPRVTASSEWKTVSQSSTWATASPSFSPPIGDATVSQTATRTTSRPSLSTLFFAAWIVGMMAAAVAVLLSLLRVRRLFCTAEVVTDPGWQCAATTIGTQLGVRHPVRLLVSSKVGTPMAGGVWRPAIFLPQSASSWSPEHRDLVLAHELAHLAGRDPLRHLMTRIALACYWFHPLAWLAAREAAIAREQACDETVLSMGARPSAYARVLLDLAESVSAAPPARLLGVLPMVHRSHLEKRLMAILNGDTRPATRRLIIGPAIGVALLTLSVAAATPALSDVEAQGGVVIGVPGGVATGVPGGVPGGVAAGVPGGVVAGVQGGVIAGVPGGGVAGVQGAPFGAADVARFAQEQARPFAETYARPFAEMQARPFAETLARLFAGAPSGIEEVPPIQGRESACLWESGSGSFIGSMSSSRVGGRTVVTDQVGWRDGDRIIQRSFGDLRLCMLAEGAGDRTNAERPSQWIGRARRIVMEAHRGNTMQRLELTGSRTSWQVDGSTREFNSTAQTWRDRMLAVLDTTWEVSTLRGEVSSLRGQISAIQGQRSALQGEISALQGAVSAMQGGISSVLGEESALRGQISAIRGHLSALQGKISAERGAISSLQASRYRYFTPADPGRMMVDMSIEQRERNRIATEIADHEAVIVRIEREIRDYGAERRIAAVQKEIDSFDTDAKVAAIERQIRDFDLKDKVAAVQRRIADLDVEGQVARIDRQIDALDADRRARQLDDRLDGELNRLNSAIAAIR